MRAGQKRHSLPVGRIRGSCFSVREPGRGDILRQRPRPETLLSDAADFRRSLRVVPVAFGVVPRGRTFCTVRPCMESAVPLRKTFFRVRTSGRNTAGPQRTERSGTATVRGRAVRCSDDGTEHGIPRKAHGSSPAVIPAPTDCSPGFRCPKCGRGCGTSRLRRPFRDLGSAKSCTSRGWPDRRC